MSDRIFDHGTFTAEVSIPKFIRLLKPLLLLLLFLPGPAYDRP